MIENGITFGSKHTYKDFGLILVNRIIGEPSAQTKMVTVPTRDGDLDMSEVLTGTTKYNDRPITLKFRKMICYEKRLVALSEISNAIHGQKLRIIFDDDQSFYYVGRPQITEVEDNKAALDIEIECVCEPYKYYAESSAEDWLWDPFDFEQGIINETGDLIVDGSLSYTLICFKKQARLKFTSSSSMVLSVDGEIYNIVEGTQILYGLVLSEGEHVFTFTGNGTVTIDYVGGSL